MGHGLFFAARIAVIPILIAAIVFFELERPFESAHAFALLSLFLLFADLTSLASGKSRDFLLLASSFVVGVIAIEVTAERISPEPAQTIDTPKLSVYWPGVGWGPHAGRFHVKKINPITKAVIFSVDYTIDSNLSRQTHSCDTCATIAFFGDSFTFGVGVNDADTLPQAFSDSVARKQRVLNLAFPGYGPQQFLRELETGRFDKAIGTQPKLFVFLTSPWHAERTSCKRPWTRQAPRYALEQGKVVYKGSCYEGARLWLPDWIVHTAIYRAFFEPIVERLTHDDVDLYIRILLAAVNLAKEKYGAPTLIPYIRVPEAYLRGTGFSNADIVQQLQIGGANVVDVSLWKQRAANVSIPGDGHPTPYANRLRAEILKNYIQAMPGILPPEGNN